MNLFIQTRLDGFLCALLLALSPSVDALSAEGTKTMANPSESTVWFETELDPAYLRWVRSPGELRGFWFAHSREETKERTGANTFSSHISLHLAEDAESPGGFRVESPFTHSRSAVEMGFRTEKPISDIRVLVSTALEGAAGTVELYRGQEDDERLLVGSRDQANARLDSWVVLSPEGPSSSFSPGEYVLVVKSRKMKVDVWPGPSANPDTWIGDPAEGPDSIQRQTALLARVSFTDGTWTHLREDEQERPWLSIGSHDPGIEAEQAGMFFNVDLGEHNNPFFIYYPEAFQKAFPDAFMRDLDGKAIRIESNPIHNISNPVPAVDDPDLRRLSRTLVQEGAMALRTSPWLRYYVIAGEECYPDYFGVLPTGDFREAFTSRFGPYSRLRAWGLAFDREEFRAHPSGRLGRAWYLFREHALADRAADYMRTFLEADPNHPVLYPTHGNPFFGPGQSGRKQMGYPPGLIAGACDGFETGQISIDTDVEWLNLLTVCHTASWGVPVVSPRLGNKTLDPSARGGGRSFTPVMLRRLAYEALGHGVWHIGLLQWTGTLGDGEWFIRDTPAEKEARLVFEEIETASPYLAGMSRLQPKVALYLSDSTWLQEGWQARWTGFYQDALSSHWQIALAGDEMLGANLTSKVPVLISLDNRSIDTFAVQGLKEYLEAGGRLIRWGDFAQADELGTPYERDPLKGFPRVVTLQQPPGKVPRELLNACTTGSGAHKHVTRYQPTPFEPIRQTILSEVKETVLCPVRVETTGEVHSYTLTDGWNLVVVLLNHGTEPAAVSLEPPAISGEDTAGWRWKRIDLAPNAQTGTATGAVALTLAGSGSALVWLSPGAERASLDERLVRCQGSLDRWSALAADTGSLRVCLDESREAQLAGIEPKAYALSERILRSLGVRADLIADGAGALRIRAGVFDPSGAPVAGARVTYRLVPGPFHWRPLPESQPGIYETGIPDGEKPVVFDPQKGSYEKHSGPIRLIVHAVREGREGHCLRTVVAGEDSPDWRCGDR